MAIIPLRQYNREIEGLIDTAQLDEAVAHCRYILETFPKHIATYRLLGKAYLEQQRYGDAADIFQRVLSSIPDDHVTNIGMSIIREDEGNLDAAIWYMERALESQPSNAAIKDELRRLYGRRDGIEPPKIRLTRGALARMYARGGLYDQAIGELRAALVDDPQRPDLLVLLAQMYFNLGQVVEAVDTCGNLIKKLPYCLVANRILATILPQTGRAEDTKTYHHRTIAMDPYFATASVNALTADAVPEAAVNIERLAYRPGHGAGSAAQPPWAASLGISFEEQPGDQLPEWLQDQSVPEPKPEKDAYPSSPAPFSWETPSEDTSAEAEKPVSAEDIIPDWMKDAGWQPATGAAQEDQIPNIPETPPTETEGDIARAELPDWLKNLAPASLMAEPPSEEPSSVEDVDLPWLQQATPGASDTIVNWLGTQKTTGDAAIMPPEQPTAQPPQAPIEAPVPPISDQGDNGNLPDWLKGVEATYEKSGITDWLRSSHRDEPEGVQPVSEEQPVPAEEVPEWLHELSATAEEATAPAEELPGWLTEMRESEAEFPMMESPFDKAAEPAEEIPDWLKGMAEASGGSTAPVEELPDWLTQIGKPEAEAAAPGFTERESAAPLEEIPDWLREMGEPTEKPASELAPSETVNGEPILRTEQIVEIGQEISEIEKESTRLEPAEEIPDWLKEMAEPAVETVLAEPAIIEPFPPAEQVPDWLKEMAEPAAETVLAEPATVEPALPAEQVPDWLKEMAEPGTETVATESATAEPGLPAEQIPDWLTEVMQPGPEPPAMEPPFEQQLPPAEEMTEHVLQVSQPAEELEIPEPEIGEVELLAGDLPYWLKETADLSSTDAGIVPVEPLAEEPAMPDIELPEWLLELGQPGGVDESAPIELEGKGEQIPLEEIPAQSAEELPDWLKEMSEPTATPPSPFIKQSDQDAALAWLETLATGHGAREEELITKPEERLESMPDWIKAEAEEAQAQDAAVSPASAFDLSDQDSALAWLETLAARQGANEEELITKPEQRPEAMPEWIKAGTQESGPEQLPTQPAGPEELPDWLAETAISAETAQLTQPQPEIDELPDWLQETVTAPTDETGEQSPGEVVALPAWLQDAETPAAPPWMPEAILPETELPTPEPLSQIPAIPEAFESTQPASPQAPAPELQPEILDINTASLTQLERLPGIGFMTAQNIINYRDEHGPFTTLADLANVPGFDAGILDQPDLLLTIAVPAPTEELAVVVETEETIFTRARQAVERGEVITAAQLYNQLIAQKADLEEVIADMQIALYRYPVDINFWQIVGDAYLRTDKLQEALDAYTKAEELLR